MAESSDPTWSRVDAILAQALERPDAERSSGIRETCGSETALAAEAVAHYEGESLDRAREAHSAATLTALAVTVGLSAVPALAAPRTVAPVVTVKAAPAVAT